MYDSVDSVEKKLRLKLPKRAFFRGETSIFSKKGPFCKALLGSKKGPFCKAKESRATSACLYRTSGRFYMLQFIFVDSRHFTWSQLSELPLWRYQLRMWACSGTASYWKRSWAVINLKVPSILSNVYPYVRQFFAKPYLSSGTYTYREKFPPPPAHDITQAIPGKVYYKVLRFIIFFA